MKPYLASLINAVILISFGLWGYLGSDTPSPTALIPVGAGIVLAVLNIGLKRENRVIAHVVVVLTLLILIALIKPLSASLGRSDWAAFLRVVVMIFSTIVAMVYFVRSFIQARKNRGE